MKTSQLGIVVVALFSLTCSHTNGNGRPSPPSGRPFASPEQAVNALVDATAAGDVPSILGILGKEAEDIVSSEDRAGDKARAEKFVERYREKHSIVPDSQDPSYATLLVGSEDWPLPIPLIQRDGAWYFDAQEGRDELIRRRIGANELDAITVCRGYAEAQLEYASRVHDDSGVAQYAQRIISTPGKQDGLAWQNPDGSWDGPVGEAVARGIEEGFVKKGEPYHGYYFKVLKGQGPSARLGQLDYVVGGAMIGGFALLAWPAEYRVTGVKTFIVSWDGVVYEKDFGAQTPTLAPVIERYDPDETWKRTSDDW